MRSVIVLMKILCMYACFVTNRQAADVSKSIHNKRKTLMTSVNYNSPN